MLKTRVVYPEYNTFILFIEYINPLSKKIFHEFNLLFYLLNAKPDKTAKFSFLAARGILIIKLMTRFNPSSSDNFLYAFSDAFKVADAIADRSAPESIRD
jgi:hypothetical protein